jgi:2-keto-4-pentenoate hydratase/2-oxohepta-3-ene-1,7-dioic acid hydratase in catechol pathway
MRLVSYRADDGSLRAGLVDGDAVVDLEETAAQHGLVMHSDLGAILAREDEAWAALARIVAEAATAPERLPLADLELGPVLPWPPKILLLAGNYQSHITESGAAAVDKAAITPRFFIKPGTAVIGTGEPILIPPVSETVDYEIEIAAVISKRGRDIAVEQADEHIFGYAVFNDVSARRLKNVGHRKHRAGDEWFDWLVGKWCDSFAVIGPYLVSRDEIADVTALEMALRVNGELRQHSSAGEMIFTVPEAIAWISGFITLEPGDLICMGTPGGVGATTETYLKTGDVVTGEIEQLGTIENVVQ